MMSASGAALLCTLSALHIVLTPLARDLRDDNFGRDLVYPFLDIERIQKTGRLDYDVTALANEIGSSV